MGRKPKSGAQTPRREFEKGGLFDNFKCHKRSNNTRNMKMSTGVRNTKAMSLWRHF